MWLNFIEYCKRRGCLLGEMAQSKGDSKGIQIHLDDLDRDFIAQAVAKGISDVSALRTRYTLLLHDKPGESGPVRFFGSRRRPFVTANIERTHLKHLQDKLRDLGATNAAEHGFTPLRTMDPSDTAAYYNAAFGRQNASDILRKGKPIDINYGRGGVGTTVTIARKTTAASAPKPGRSAIVRPVPNDWSSSYLSVLFQDKSRTGEVGKLLTPHDFTQVWRAVHSLVGDTSEPDKYILPEVWSVFQQSLPEIGETVFRGVIRQLRQFDPSAAENALELKQAMMQTIAMILSNPIRGRKKAGTGDFIRDVTNFFSNPGEVFKLAMSYTSQGHLRKVSGINTANTRRREIGGEMTARPYDLDNMGREDAEHRSDVEIEAELRSLEPAVERIRTKLQRNNWDTTKLTDREFDLFAQYEGLTKELQRFKGNYRGSGQRSTGAATLARKPNGTVECRLFDITHCIPDC